MNKELKELIKDKILRERMSIDEVIEYIWSLKDKKVGDCKWILTY